MKKQRTSSDEEQYVIALEQLCNSLRNEMQNLTHSYPQPEAFTRRFNLLQNRANIEYILKMLHDCYRWAHPALLFDKAANYRMTIDELFKMSREDWDKAFNQELVDDTMFNHCKATLTHGVLFLAYQENMQKIYEAIKPHSEELGVHIDEWFLIVSDQIEQSAQLETLESTEEEETADTKPEPIKGTMYDEQDSDTAWTIEKNYCQDIDQELHLQENFNDLQFIDSNSKFYYENTSIGKARHTIDAKTIEDIFNYLSGDGYMYHNQEQLNLLAYRITGRLTDIHSKRIIWKRKGPSLDIFISIMFSNSKTYFARGQNYFVFDDGTPYHSQGASRRVSTHPNIKQDMKKHLPY